MQDIKLTIIYMRILKNFLGLFLLTAFIISCVDENESNADFVGTISEPTNISALVSITQDNTGLVTITPTGEGVVTFHVDYGDGSDMSGSINPGNSTDHVYMEGTYEATIIGTALDGSTAEGNVTIVVSFIAPENLVVNLISSSGSYNILVSATADYATSFEVLFGDEAGGDATPMQLGEQLSHTYESAGTYNLIVTALSGGSATTQYSEDVVITDPPVFDGFSTFEDFEGEVPGNFSFGGVGNVQVVANPDNSGINSSANVMQCTKDQGAEVWGGMGFAVDGHINFNGNNVLRLKSYAPEVGKVVKVKLETSAGNVSGLTYEFDMVTTVANQWEILTYDFSGAPDLDYITAIVFYDFGNQDAGVYHFDDVEVGIGEYIQGIENFEDDVPESFSFGGVGSVEVIPNPDPSGENSTGNVLQFVKDDGAEVWGGMGFAVDVIDFNGASQIHIKSYAPESGKVVKVKLETSAGNVAGLTHEVDMTTTVANQWETLVYDFTGAPDLEYVSFIVFYDFGNTAGATYRVDEIQLID
jgi:hypothetical protein